MAMHKTNAELEGGAKPDRRIIDEMGKLVFEAHQNGEFTGTNILGDVEVDVREVVQG